MAHKDAEAAIEARLRANWTHCDIFTENRQNEQPADGTAFLGLQFPFNEVGRWSLGTRHYREEGGFRIVISIPRGTGMEKIRDWGEDLRLVFLDVSFAAGAGKVNCRVPGDPFSDDRSDAGPYYVAYMVCPYDFQFRSP